MMHSAAGYTFTVGDSVEGMAYSFSHEIRDKGITEHEPTFERMQACAAVQVRLRGWIISDLKKSDPAITRDSLMAAYYDFLSLQKGLPSGDMNGSLLVESALTLGARQ